MGVSNNKLNNNGFNVDEVRAEPISAFTKEKAPEIIWDGVTTITEWMGFKKQQRLILGPNKTETGSTDMINLNLMTYALIPWLHKTKNDYEDYTGKGITLDRVEFETKWQKN